MLLVCPNRPPLPPAPVLFCQSAEVRKRGYQAIAACNYTVEEEGRALFLRLFSQHILLVQVTALRVTVSGQSYWLVLSDPKLPAFYNLRRFEPSTLVVIEMMQTQSIIRCHA